MQASNLQLTYIATMDEEKVFTLINEQNGDLAFKLFSFNDNSHFDHLQRNNFYTVLLLKGGNGLLKVDFSEYTIKPNTFFAFSPFQPFMFSTSEKLSGVAVQFHSDFYCIHRNPNETNCDAVLFNNIYQPPFFDLDKEEELKLELLLDQLRSEFTNNSSGNHELLIPGLKMLLGNASRIKVKRKGGQPKFIKNETPFILKRLNAEIEQNFKLKHSASDYAKLLSISPNALAKLVKTHYNKTLTNLIKERIIIEAKRELYMTSKSIKEIAWSLGYSDEYYFSRVFKASSGISPQMYRDTVGFGKAELN